MNSTPRTFEGSEIGAPSVIVKVKSPARPGAGKVELSTLIWTAFASALAEPALRSRFV